MHAHAGEDSGDLSAADVAARADVLEERLTEVEDAQAEQEELAAEEPDEAVVEQAETAAAAVVEDYPADDAGVPEQRS